MTIEYKTLTAALKDHRRDDLSVTFIEGVNNEVQVTYAQLYERALQLLHHFQSMGLKPGDELIFFLKDNEKFLYAFWACLLGGIIPVPVAVGISDEHRSKIFRIFARLKQPYLLIDQKTTTLLQAYAGKNNLLDQYAQIEQKICLLEDIPKDGEYGVEHLPSADDIAFIQFSSGSTRDPKGVCLTHKNLVATVVDMGGRGQYSSVDISLSWMPLTHDLGLIGFHITMAVFGMNQYIMATDVFSRRPLLWLQKVSEKRATILSSPNFGYKHYLKVYATREVQGLDLSCVRLILNGAEPISISLCERFLDTMKPHGLKRSAMYPSYGLAEATLGVSMPMPGQEYQYIQVGRNGLKFGEPVQFMPSENDQTIRFAVEGPPLERCAVRIANDSEESLGEDTIGEIQIQGPNVTSGYYNDDEANEGLFTKDGWLCTGDLGLLHDGQVVVTGRLKDIIFANGQNYFPHDLEAIITHQTELELGKVVALGARENDADHDTILVCVLYRGDADDFPAILKAVKWSINEQTGLEVDHVIPVHRIPKTTSGKVQRRFFVDAYLNGEYAELIDQLEELQQTPATADVETQHESEYLHKIKFICANLLADKNIKVDDNFFEIGLSSLDLAQIHEKIDESYPGVLDIVDMFDHSTIELLAKFVENKVSN